MTKDGGPAFPSAMDWTPDGMEKSGGDGMSLRDYFAAASITGCMALVIESSRKDGVVRAADRMAAAAYEMADAMLAERDK